MALLAIDEDGFVSVGHVLEDGLFVVELVAHLVEVGDGELCAVFDGAGGRREFAEQEFEQGGLTRAVGADDSDAVSAHDGGVEGLEDLGISVGYGRLKGGDDFCSRGVALLEGERGGSGSGSP